jgi:hypothetical protein
MSASPPVQNSTTISLRVLTALAVLTSGLCHGYLYFYDGWRDINVIGPLFMVNAVSGIVLAVLVLAWRHWFSLFLTFGFCVVTASAFLISRWWGLFGIQDRVWGWSQILCLIAEVVGALAALAAFFAERWLVTARSAPRGRVVVPEP